MEIHSHSKYQLFYSPKSLPSPTLLSTLEETWFPVMNKIHIAEPTEQMLPESEI